MSPASLAEVERHEQIVAQIERASEPADGADDPSGLVADIAQPALGMTALPPDIAGRPFCPTRASSWLQISNRSASGCACAISVRRAASPLI
jgi:hypothetical protein